MTKVLLVDVDAARRRALHDMLLDHGLDVVEAIDFRAASQLDCDVQVITSHADLAGARGIDLRVIAPQTPLVLYAERASIRCAVEAMQLGASDYLAIPFEPIELVNSIRRSLRGTASGRQTYDSDDSTAQIIGSCAAMRGLRNQIGTLSQRGTCALIRGEAGTGKELLARSIHAASIRNRRPFVVVNCTTMAAGLVESELFGNAHAQSSETPHAPAGALHLASRGTLFLDELSALSSAAQDQLLRALQEAAHDVVVIGASHRDLHQLVRSGNFNAALYEHLCTTTLYVPPLREREGDVVELALALLQRTCVKLSKPGLELSLATLAAIREYHWPGNVRELENALERAVILCDSLVIDSHLLALPSVPKAPAEADPPLRRDEQSSEMSLENYFVNFVLEHQNAFTETELASKLGISRKSLWERRQRLNIPRKRHRGAAR